ncbi:MAG: sigma-70 family RNA polymerase sigma factor [Planctomycetota bacterium]
MKTIIQNRPSSESATIVRKLSPSARMPAPGILRSFSPAALEALQRRLMEPVECVYHPSFRRATMPSEADEPHVSGPDVPPVDPDYDMGGTPARATEVLSPEQERALFLRFNYCRHQVMLVLRRFRGKRLTGTAARELLRWDRLAHELRGDIVRANTSLVLAMARRSRNNGVELGELVSEGNLALLRCVDKFDASRGFKFSTYACRAILASFSRAGAKAARHRSQFPTPYDPAMERSDHLEAKRDRLEHECVDELKRILFDNSADLSPVERRVLTARFSLDQANAKPGLRRKTLDQVGDLLGVSKERVRQIQNQAMIKLRAVLEERLLAAS